MYENVFSNRYITDEISQLISEKNHHVIWRELWIALAQYQNELGLNVSKEQVSDLKNTKSFFDYDLISKYEKELKHDVMAHIKAWESSAPIGGGIIHLGATSCFVKDNAYLIVIYKCLELIKEKLEAILISMVNSSVKYSDEPCIAYTHFQKAQATTVGRRFAMWAQPLHTDYLDLLEILKNKKLRGVRGAVGTQESFLELFNGDIEKVKELDSRLCSNFGFDSSYYVSGQTYPRKFDTKVIQLLASISASLSKVCSDIRLLSSTEEVREGFLENQVGSSAMAYKKNPIVSERICGISRHVISLSANALHTEANQWLERSLDDSSNRRITINEAIAGTDYCLSIFSDVIENLNVNLERINDNLMGNYNNLFSEKLIMRMSLLGHSRQNVHERVRLNMLNGVLNKEDEFFRDIDFASLDGFGFLIKNSKHDTTKFRNEVIDSIEKGKESL